MSEPTYVTGTAAIAEVRTNLESGTSPIRYPIGDGDLASVEIGPGLVTLVGGPPGAGKTAFVMQAAIDALRLTESLNILVCNVEMPPSVLIERQLARISGVDATIIRSRQLNGEHRERVELGLTAIEAVGERLVFARPPYSLENIAATADVCGSTLLVLDYIQRITPPGSHGDNRRSVEATMNHLRRFADQNIAVLALSAVGRTKDSLGRSSYDAAGLSLASFRESSELEFGADDAYMLDSQRNQDMVTLRHLKNRHGACRDLKLQFDRSLQRFSSITAEPTLNLERPNSPSRVGPLRSNRS